MWPPGGSSALLIETEPKPRDCFIGDSLNLPPEVPDAQYEELSLFSLLPLLFLSSLPSLYCDDPFLIFLLYCSAQATVTKDWVA